MFNYARLFIAISRSRFRFVLVPFVTFSLFWLSVRCYFFVSMNTTITTTARAITAPNPISRMRDSFAGGGEKVGLGEGEAVGVGLELGVEAGLGVGVVDGECVTNGILDGGTYC